LEVPRGLRRGGHRSEAAWIESAARLIDLVCRSFGIDDLADVSVLDMGCGTKITKALIDGRRPIGRYVGIDVDPSLIAFLDEEVDDPRFEFHHIDVQNDRYNPNGVPLSERTSLPLGDERFDIIQLFSVFTHLGPEDFVAMLRLLRKYASDDGHLLFSLYINEVTGTGYGPLDWRASSSERARERFADALERRMADEGDDWFADQLQQKIHEQGDEWFAETMRDRLSQEDDEGPRRFRYADASGQLRSTGDPPDFVDLVPDQPLLEALYSEQHARRLIDGTGWRPISLNRPEPHYIQHYFICRPG
jgi:SAM-dependent methyltransferase